MSGRRIQYIDLAPDELRNNLIHQAGMPAWLADHVVEIHQLAIAGPEFPTTTVTEILGRPPRTLDAFLNEHRTHFG